MKAIKTICGAIDQLALRSPKRLALASPFQNVQMNYEEMKQTTNALAAWLSLYGFEKNDILISDLPNTKENLLLQIACNRLGVGYGTVKGIEGMAKFPKVKGAVSAKETGFLAETGLPLPYLSGEFLVDLIDNNGLDNFTHEEIDEGDENSSHGFYNTTTPYTNKQALAHGKESAKELSITENDVLCVSITLCHPFGTGSAVCSAFQTGASIVLPAVGGIQGCGVPSERASATLQVLESEKCTLLFADTHTLKALPVPSDKDSLSLRSGVCKIGSGSSFLEDTREYSGITLRTMGKIEK